MYCCEKATFCSMCGKKLQTATEQILTHLCTELRELHERLGGHVTYIQTAITKDSSLDEIAAAEKCLLAEIKLIIKSYDDKTLNYDNIKDLLEKLVILIGE